MRRYLAPMLLAAIIVVVSGGGAQWLIQLVGSDDAQRIVFVLLFCVIGVHVAGLSLPKAFPRLHRRLLLVYGLAKD